MPTFWKSEKKLVLASKSSARAHLLGAAGFVFETEDANIDERSWTERQGLRMDAPEGVALALARAKAAAVSRRRPEDWVIGADQTLACGDALFHKPATMDEARTHLRALSGRKHRLHSALACFHDGVEHFAHVATAHMYVRALSDAFISHYLSFAGPDVLTSVGCYRIEGAGVHLFERVEGDHATILGLPLLPLLDFFRRSQLIED